MRKLDKKIGLVTFSGCFSISECDLCSRNCIWSHRLNQFSCYQRSMLHLEKGENNGNGRLWYSKIISLLCKFLVLLYFLFFLLGSTSFQSMPQTYIEREGERIRRRRGASRNYGFTWLHTTTVETFICGYFTWIVY